MSINKLMNTTQYIEELYKRHIPEKVWKRSNGLLPDFSQHCYLKLLSQSDEKIQQLAEQNKLEDYFYMLCRRQSAKGSSFWAMFNEKIEVQYVDNNDIERLAEKNIE